MSDRTLESYVSEIAANTDKTANYLKDVRSLLTDHRVREVFIESQCDHIVGFMFLSKGQQGVTNGLVKQSQNMKNFQINKLFCFCPECGSKLR